MPLSKFISRTSLSFLSYSNNYGLSSGSKTLQKTALTLGLCCGFASWAQAELPTPVETALARAQISSDDISLIIMPVTAASESNAVGDSTATEGSKARPISKLPKIIEPEVAKSEQVEDLSNHDADALPPEDSVNIEAKITSSTQLAKTINPAKDGVSVNQNGQGNRQSKTAQSSQNKTVNINPLATKTETTSTLHKPLSYPIRHLADLPRTPASTMKLIPTFVALDLLGPDFVWFNKVYHTGYVISNTLYGDLIIRGSGDPKLTTQRLNKLLEQVRNTGIQHIKGDIILDSSIFQGVTKDPAAFDNDPLRPYNASPDGLLINFSSIAVTAAPLLNDHNKGGSKLYYQPNLADYNLPSNLNTSSTGSCRSARSALAPVWQSEGLKFNKALPNSCGTHTFYIAYPSAKEFAKKVVKNQWLNLGNSLTGNIKFLGLGNTVSGEIINTESPIKSMFGSYFDMGGNIDNSSRTPKLLSTLPSLPFPFVSYPSLPLSQQIYDINHYSNNVMTEQVTLSLPLYSNPSIKKGKAYTAVNNATELANAAIEIKARDRHYSDYPQALSTIDHWWQQNLTTFPPAMTNGSGLCRDCSVTAENLAELLHFAYYHRDFDTYVNSLGIAGISGTIAAHADRLPKSEAIGRAWIKTGTLNNVTSMAGYVNGQSGQDYVVVGIINGSNNKQTLNTYQARYVLDTMLDWTAKQ